MTLSKTFDAFLSLVRLGIGHDANGLPDATDWTTLKNLADDHGLSAVVLDGIEKLNANPGNSVLGLSAEQKLEWIGETWLYYETRYGAYKDAIGSLAGFYGEHGLRMMVLKGYACSLDWPKPLHRPVGDIDIWLFGHYREADALLASETGLEADTSHHHHTVFDWQGFMVENHYDFINVHHHKSNVAFEAILKDLGNDDSQVVEVNGETVYLPSPNLHALFLLKHLMMHFASEFIVLRQVLDWGFFVEKHGKDVDWNYVLKVLDRFGMQQMTDIINAICVENFGFDARIFPGMQFDPKLKEKVLYEILAPRYGSSLPDAFLKRIVFKMCRWKANEWKHRLCYKDSMWSAFWSGVWGHLLKPKSI